MPKYKSRRTFINALKRKEYNRYSKNFEAKVSKLEKKGLTPYDSLKLTYQEYFAQKSLLQAENETNIQRKIIQEQIYKYSYKSTVALKKSMKERGMEEANLSLMQIRTGYEFDMSFLSDVNEELKKQFPNMTGKERAAYISKEWFGYAS